MKLETIISASESMLPHIERYVNDGSPSGFSTLHTTSTETSPFGLNPYFSPYICVAPDSCFKTYGKIPILFDSYCKQGENWVLVHPDMHNHKFFQNKHFQIFKHAKLKASPTSSGRTIQILNVPQKPYIKLHYDGILGRVLRAIPYRKAISGPELSIQIIHAINCKQIDTRLSLFPEIGARVLINQEYSDEKAVEWGMVWRESSPYQIDAKEIKHIIPVFSLFSRDILAPNDKPLLSQIIEYKKVSPNEYVMNEIVIPIIECYFNLITSIGLQPEWNAQNLLVGFDSNFNPIKFIMRDIESIDKDLSLKRKLGLDINYDSYPFKCIHEEQYNYKIKHSFMFDYKLGDYILEPLLLFLLKFYNYSMESNQNEIKIIVKKYLKNLPDNYFPEDGCWYILDNVLVDQSQLYRPYIALPDPKFR